MRYLFIVLILFNISIGVSQSKLAKEHISILTSDSMAGRGFLNNGQQKAADYIIAELEKFNLRAGNNNRFKQELSYPVNTFPGNVQFSVQNKKVVKIYSSGKDYLFHSASAKVEVKDEIRTISSNYSFLKKHKNQVFYIEKTEYNDKETQELVERFLFQTTGKGNLLIVQDSSKWNWFPSTKQSENAVIYIKDKLKKDAKISASTQAEFISDFHSSNVIGKVKGKRSDSVMMLSAHYDHLGQMGNAIFPGGNDNASGVAMLLSLAKYYGLNQPEFDTYFLFTTAEEIGLLGSYYFIENPPFDLRKIKMLINLDMVGTGDDGITVVNAKKQSRYFDLLQKLNEGKVTTIKARGAACNSDHCLFDQRGIPAVFIYTLGGKQAYHDIYDTGDDLSLEAFDELHQLIIESLGKY